MLIFGPMRKGRFGLLMLRGEVGIVTGVWFVRSVVVLRFRDGRGGRERKCYDFSVHGGDRTSSCSGEESILQLCAVITF